MSREPIRAEIVVVGAGPAGVMAAMRAAELGAKTALVTRDGFGGMAANDGPIPVRALAHAARLMREARQLGQYGIDVGEPALDYPRLLARVREVAGDFQRHSGLRERVDGLGVSFHEQAGPAGFVDSHTIETGSGLRIQGEKFILCVGGMSRSLAVPGAEFTATHSGAWSLTSVPPSMLVIGAGATGAQVASIFSAFGSRVELLSDSRILPGEDEDVSVAVAAGFRQRGIRVSENIGAITSFERTPGGVRVNVSKDGVAGSAEAALAVVAIGWQADTAALGLAVAGVETDARGFVRVGDYLATSAPHVFAAGDITGDMMLVPQAVAAGFVAATNAVRGPIMPRWRQVSPIGSFTDPEYAQVGLTEARAREQGDVTVVTTPFDITPRTIIDGRTDGFCKLVVGRETLEILGCHVVGERAVETVQVAAVAMAGGMTVADLGRIPLSFPTYTAILARACNVALRQLGRDQTESGLNAALRDV
jgi:pyruvate/2-oxoglutarate dehydrogenase complex dihydrolipoamide dehydrogenase (E3) component